MTMSTGEIRGQDVDVAYAARLYTETAGPDDKEASRSLWPSFLVSKLSMSDQSGGFSYEELRSDGFSAKMPAQPLVETLAAITAVQNIDDLTSEPTPGIFRQGPLDLRYDGKSNIQLIGLKIDAPGKGFKGRKINGRSPPSIALKCRSRATRQTSACTACPSPTVKTRS